MQIRITAPVVEYGTTQLLRGQVLTVPEDLALDLVGREEASLVPFAETAVLPRSRPETAVITRPVGKPKLPSQKGRRS